MPAHEQGHASRRRNAVQPSARPSAPVPPVLALQRSAGNAAVSRLVEVQRERDEERHEHGAGCGHDQPVQRSSVLDVVRAPGSPVDPAIRAKAERGMGTYLGDVVVHTGAAARRSAAELGARAYTSGRHIVLGEGGNDEHTMLHELRHAWQQRRGPVAGTDNGGGLSVSTEDDRDEKDAEAWAHRMRNASAQAEANVRPADTAPAAATASASGPASVQRARRGEEDPYYEENGVSYVTRESIAGVPRRRDPDQNTLMREPASTAVRSAGRTAPGNYSWLHRESAWSHGDPVHGTPQRRSNMLAGTQETNMEHLRSESSVSRDGVSMLGAPVTQLGVNGRLGPNVFSRADYVVRSPYDPMNNSYRTRLDPFDTRPVGARERAGDLRPRREIHRDMERQYARWTMDALPESALPDEYREFEERRRRSDRSDRSDRSSSPSVRYVERRPRR